MLAGTLPFVSADGPAQIPSARVPGVPHHDTLFDFVLRSVIPGFIATVLVGIGALGVGWLPLDTILTDTAVVEALRSTTFGAIVSKIAVVAGIVLLLQSWLLLGFDVLRGRVANIRWLWLALTAWCVPLMVTPPLFSRDVYSYFAQGKLMVEGVNPYTHGSASVPGWFADGVDPLWAEAPTPYGQFWLLLARGVAEFTGPHPYSGALFLRMLAVAGVALLAWAVPRIAMQCGIDDRKALWLGVLNPLVLMHFVSGAHNDALMVGLIAAGFAVTLERWPILGVVLISLAGCIKPIGLVALPFVGLLWAGPVTGMARVWIRWIYSGLIALAVVLPFGIFTGTGLGWIAALSTPGEVRTWLSPPTAVGMAVGGLLSLLGLDVLDACVAVARLIGLVASVVILAWLCLRPYGRNPVKAAAIALLTVVVLGPVVQPWYLLWSLPLFAAVGLTRKELRVAIVGTAGFTLFGLLTSSATQDSLLQIPDAVAAIAVAILLAILLATSSKERNLLLGQGSTGLAPDSPGALERSKQLMLRAPP